MNKEHWPKLGVGVVLFRDNSILLGKRINAHGENTWSLAGGHVEPFESPYDAAIREAREETGLEIDNVWAGPWINVVFEKERKHYVTFFMCANAPLTEPQLREPDKCTGWQWFDLNNLPSPLFLPIDKLLKNDPEAFLKCKSLHASSLLPD